MYREKAWLLVIVIVWEGMGESSIGQEKGMDAGKQITNKYKPMILVNNRNQIKTIIQIPTTVTPVSEMIR